jgi:hypothetical protein
MKRYNLENRNTYEGKFKIWEKQDVMKESTSTTEWIQNGDDHEKNNAW